MIQRDYEEPEESELIEMDTSSLDRGRQRRRPYEVAKAMAPGALIRRKEGDSIGIAANLVVEAAALLVAGIGAADAHILEHGLDHFLDQRFEDEPEC